VRWTSAYCDFRLPVAFGARFVWARGLRRCYEEDLMKWVFLILGDYESVIAPRLAVDTSLVYLASTPAV
jgi:hypothetical protein